MDTVAAPSNAPASPSCDGPIHPQLPATPSPTDGAARPCRARLYEATATPCTVPTAPISAAPPRPQMLNRLLSAPGRAAQHAIVQALMHKLGFDHLAYAQLAVVDERPVPQSICISWADTAWLQRYVKEDFHRVDPRLVEAGPSTLPCIWALDDLMFRAPAHLPTEALASFVAALRHSGLRSGVMFGLPGDHMGDRRVVSLMSRRPGSEWIDDGVLGQAWTLALSVHEYLRHDPAPAVGSAGAKADELASTDPTARVLSPLQRSILRCLASGLSDKGIASYLDLTLHNVDYHMRQLRKRFGVRNRVQLMQAVMRITLQP